MYSPLQWNSSILIGCVKSCDYFQPIRMVESYLNKTEAGIVHLCPEVVVRLEKGDLDGLDVQVHQDVPEGQPVPWL